MKYFFIFLLFAFVAQSGVSQDVTILQRVNVIDGTGHRVKANQFVTITGGKITAIGSTRLNTTANAILVDLAGKYIMPTIINTHGHLGNLKDTISAAGNYTAANVRNQLLRYEQYGVSAILSMGTEQPIGVALRDSSRQGQIPGATMYSALYGFGVKNGLPPGMPKIYRPETAEEAVKFVRELAPLKPDVIKMWVDDFWGQFPTMKEEVYTAIISEAHKNGIRVASHVYHIADARKLVAAGVDIFAHSIRDSVLDDALIAAIKKKHIMYIPTLSLDEFAYIYQQDVPWINDPFFQAALEPGVLQMITNEAYKEKLRKNPVAQQEVAALQTALQNLYKLYKAGILIALGTDSGANPVRVQGFSEHVEMELMVKAGLTPLEAITIATQNGARLLRINAVTGTLEPGKQANFMVLDKNPAEDIINTRTISAVWRNGVKVNDGPVAR
ncbi:MAG TPA: amidohydrolase family protein [Niastella sp.]